MSIEPIPEVNLDAVQEASHWLREVSSFEEQKLSLVTLVSSPDRWDIISTVLCALRASNISATLLLKRSDFVVEDEEVQLIFSFLRDWDQLLLYNFLELCEGWVPQEYQAALQLEAKIELKWFREWLMAASDSRIHKYPGMPWRSFVRKVSGEKLHFRPHFSRAGR